MKNFLNKLLFVLFICSSFEGIANAGSINSFYDNFDSDNGGVQATIATSFGGWHVTSGNVELIGNGIWDAYPGNGLYVDLAGNQFGAITTNDYFAPGTYEVKIGATGTRLGDEWDGYYLNFGSNNYSSPLGNFGTNLSVTEIWTITSDSQLTIGDSGRSGNRFNGALLMSVSIQELAAVPEPSAVALFGMGLSALIFMATRRRGWRALRKSGLPQSKAA